MAPSRPARNRDIGGSSKTTGQIKIAERMTKQIATMPRTTTRREVGETIAESEKKTKRKTGLV